MLAKGANKAPWRYLDSIEVEEIGFGLVPPAFQVVQAKFDPTASMLTLSMDVRFTSSSAQAVVSPVLKLLLSCSCFLCAVLGQAACIQRGGTLDTDRQCAAKARQSNTWW